MQPIYSEVFVTRQDSDWEFIEVSEEFLKMTAVTEYEIIDRFFNKLSEFFTPQDAEVIIEYLNTLEQKEKIIPGTYSLKNNYGRDIRVMLQVEAISNYETRLCISDITAALSQSYSIVFEYDLLEHKILFSDEVYKIWDIKGDITPEILTEKAYIHYSGCEQFIKMFKSIENFEEKASCTVLVKKDDGYKWVKINMTAVFNNTDKITKAIGIVENIYNNQDHLKPTLNEDRQKWANVFDQDFACQLNLTANNVVLANKEAFPSYLNEVDDISTLFIQNANHWVHPDDRAGYIKVFNAKYMLELFNSGQNEISLDYRATTPGGGYRWQRTDAHFISEPNKILAYVYTRDIDEQKTTEIELRKHAEIDGLTGTYNRYTAQMKCQKLLELKTDDEIAALMVMDLDGFKYVNDMYGHVCGDEVLILCAQYLQELFDNSKAMVGRLGGDEFIVFIHKVASLNDVETMAKNTCECIQSILSHPYGLSVSIGVAMYPNDGVTFDELYQCADTALYDAKHMGKNCYVFYKKEMKRNNNLDKNPVSRDWLLEESNDIIYVSHLETYELLYMNSGAKALFGQDDDEYRGKKCYEVLLNNNEPCSFCTNKILTRDSFYTWEYRNTYINRSFLLKDRIVDWYGKPARIEFATDITNVDARNQQLEKQLRLQEAIIELFTKRGNMSMEETIMVLMKKTAELYNADRVIIIQKNSETAKFYLKYIWYRDNVSQLIFRNGEWEYFLKIVDIFPKNRKSYRMDDLELLRGTDAKLYKLYIINNVFCQRVVPFFLNDGLCGYICIDNPQEYKDDTTVLEALGRRLADEYETNRLQRQLYFLSYHDALTGLQNRRRFTEYIKSLNEKPVDTIGVASADINALKEINRRRGHLEGDNVVKKAAELLKKCFSKAQIFRLSGDEFLVFYENISEKKLLEGVQEVYDKSLSLDAFGISIGYAWSSEGWGISKLINQANEMMLIRKQLYYQNAKLEGFAGKHGHDRLQQMLVYIENGYFKMYLQPKISCVTEQITGAEALARFEYPGKGIVMPGQFVPELEEYYIIRYLDLHIFEQACRILCRWNKEGKKLLPISINFSRLTLLEPNILQMVKLITEKYQVNKNLLEIEITESIGSYEDETIADIGSRIKEAGFGLSLDDFGSHYTNMSILAAVPTDVLKIDKSLIRDIMVNNSNKLLLSHLFEFCRQMNIRSVAEGVETREQFEILQTMKCDEIQGYLFGKPMTVEEFENTFLALEN